MSNTGNLSALLPLVIFMAIMVGIGFYVRRAQSRGFSNNFVQQYFIGNHDLGGFVLAMTTVATYSSVSSFVGGPGMACLIRLEERFLKKRVPPKYSRKRPVSGGRRGPHSRAL